MIKDVIKELRTEYGYSKYKLSKLLGVSQQAIADWENGVSEPRAKNLSKLSECFDVSIDYLTEKESYDGSKSNTHKITAVARSKNNTIPKHTVELTDEQYYTLLEIIKQTKK